MPKDPSKAPLSAARWVGPILALLCGIIAYSNSLHGPFIFDDLDAISRNPQINANVNDPSSRNAPNTLSARPFLKITFQANAAMFGTHVTGYHLTNLLIHLIAGLLLYGIVHQNLKNPFWAGRFDRSAPWLAAGVAALWLVHPLNTEAVTYTIQRAESLAGMFYLALIYCLIRAAPCPRRRVWETLAFIFCALGMATKETMVTAPLVALVYDRVFLARSFRNAFQLRRGFYAMLAATWLIPAFLILSIGRSQSVGFSHGISLLEYARTQLDVIAHYLGLTLWPAHLVLDYYDWPIVHHWAVLNPEAIAVLLLTAASLFAFMRNTSLGFLGAWFFLILAPSSSFIPIFTEIAAEHRMYLPLIAPIALVVVGGWAIASRLGPIRRLAPFLFIALTTVVIRTTLARNSDYASAQRIWQQTIAERPRNPRAHYNLGYSLAQTGDQISAAREFQTALDLAPDYYADASALGNALARSGQIASALEFYNRQMQAFPAFAPEAHLKSAMLQMQQNDWPHAEENLRALLALQPALAIGHYYLGIVYQQLQDRPDAAKEFAATLQLAPTMTDARIRLKQSQGPIPGN